MPDDPVGFVWASIRMAWRWLTRMRTALYLLGLLALETLLATVVPQQPNVPATVADWRSGSAGPGTAVSSLIDALGGYDVYGSPLFMALLLLLFISLTACLIPRYRAFWRLARRGRPPRTRYPDSQDHVATFPTGRSPAEVEDATRKLLAGRRWRLRGPDPPDRTERQVAAEKGHLLREGGSLLFHTSFYVLLVGVVAGQLLGFTAQIGVIEGQAFTDTPVSYSTWSYDPGRWWGAGDHPGWRMRLDDFEAEWHRDPALGGQPRDFTSRVTLTRPDGSTRRATIRPNVPLIAGGLRIHQLDWGYAPDVVVEVDGRVVHDGPLTLRRAEEGPFWTGAVKAPAADPGVGLKLTFWPYAPRGDDGNPVLTGAPWAEAPLLFFQLYRGDLQLDRSQNVAELDTDRMRLVDAGGLRPGGETAAGDGVTVGFPELRQWSGLQVSNKPTLGVLLAGGLLVLVGLIPSLYAYRRRLWVQAEPAPARDEDAPRGSGEPSRTLVTVAGRAFQRPEAFAGDFDDVVAAVRDAVGAAGEPAPDEPVPVP